MNDRPWCAWLPPLLLLITAGSGSLASCILLRADASTDRSPASDRDPTELAPCETAGARAETRPSPSPLTIASRLVMPAPRREAAAPERGADDDGPRSGPRSTPRDEPEAPEAPSLERARAMVLDARARLRREGLEALSTLAPHEAARALHQQCCLETDAPARSMLARLVEEWGSTNGILSDAELLRYAGQDGEFVPAAARRALRRRGLPQPEEESR